MAKPKYKISYADLTTPGGVAKLERDGHNRHSIHEALYKHTENAPHRLREQIMSKLHDRNKPC